MDPGGFNGWSPGLGGFGRYGAIDDGGRSANLQSAMPDLFDLFARFYDSFGEEKSGGKLGVIARRPHRDRDRAVTFVGKAEPYLERLFDCEKILRGPRRKGR